MTKKVSKITEEEVNRLFKDMKMCGNELDLMELELKEHTEKEYYEASIAYMQSIKVYEEAMWLFNNQDNLDDIVDETLTIVRVYP